MPLLFSHHSDPKDVTVEFRRVYAEMKALRQLSQRTGTSELAIGALAAAPPVEAGGGSGFVMRVVGAPTSGAALPDFRISASSPADLVPVWDFSPTVIAYLILACRAPATYGGGDLRISLPFTATSGTSGNVRWGVALRNLLGEDFDPAHTWVFTEVDQAVSGTNGQPVEAVIDLTAGAAMDNITAGSIFTMLVMRNATHVNDTLNASDAELWTPYMGMEEL